MSTTPRVAGLPRRAPSTSGSPTLKPKRRRGGSAGARRFLGATRVTQSPRPFPKCSIEPSRPRRRPLIKVARPALTAVYTATCRVILLREAASLQLPSGVTSCPTPPVVMGKSHAFCVGRPSYGVSFCATISVISSRRRTSTAPPSEEMMVVGSDQPQEMIIPSSNGSLSDTRRAPSCTEISRRASIGEPQGWPSFLARSQPQVKNATPAHKP